MRTAVTASLLSVLLGAAVSGCGLANTAPSPGAPQPELPPAVTTTAPAVLQLVGLVGGTELVNFSTADVNPRDKRAVTGLAGDTALVGIDHRVQDGGLYGVGDAGGIYTIAAGGAATKVKQLSVELDGENFGVDFNPAANALRIISDTGQNLRQPFAEATTPTAEDGALTNPAVAPATGTVPAVGATSAGYTNNDEDTATGTALFVLDTTADRVVIQSPANAGTFAPMGGLGVDAAPAAGFDIYTPAAGSTTTDVTALASMQVNGTYGLYRIDVLTGKAESLGGFTDEITDIAVPLGQR